MQYSSDTRIHCINIHTGLSLFLSLTKMHKYIASTPREHTKMYRVHISTQKVKLLYHDKCVTFVITLSLLWATIRIFLSSESSSRCCFFFHSSSAVASNNGNRLVFFHFHSFIYFFFCVFSMTRFQCTREVFAKFWCETIWLKW